MSDDRPASEQPALNPRAASNPGRLSFLPFGPPVIFIGEAQWVIFVGLHRSFFASPVWLAIFIAAEASILLLTLRSFWRVARNQWVNNFWPAFIALMYISQFLALMSILDWSVAAAVSHSFAGGQHPYGLTKTDAFYFAVTTFSTVGYGDIHPVSPASKLVVAFQILVGLLLTIVLVGVFVSQLISRLDGEST